MKRVEVTSKWHPTEEKPWKVMKNVRMMMLLDLCKQHGGPVTNASVNELEQLTKQQLTTEVCYLRSTIAPNIRQKRKENKKFVNFSKSELISQIRNVINPSNNLSIDLNTLLSSAYQTRLENKN